jgi:DNA-binding NarL/FixJ family response regulator
VTVQTEKREHAILIVDDEEAHRLFTRLAVKKVVSDNAVFEASTLSEARALMTEAEFKLIILDIRLSGESGFTLLYEIRNKLALTIPVIVISTSELENDVTKSYACGASCFLHKSSSPETYQHNLSSAISYFLRLAH